MHGMTRQQVSRNDGRAAATCVDGRVAVAIPVHNEAGYIEACLQALAQQTVREKFDVVALLNNCSDGTEIVVHRLAADLPYRLQVNEYWLEPGLVNAGVARRLAMQHAASFVGKDGVLLTTDADSTVPPDWIEANLRYIDAGCDAVAGMSRMDPADEALLPPHLAEDEAKVMAYAAMLDEIDYRLNPTEHDPWPRHTEHSGASIAVRAEMHDAVGGIAGVASGEDRQFFDALRRIDAKIRHAPEIVVTVSGRLVGRAVGGMAETMARRMREADEWLDADLESAQRSTRRAKLRAAVSAARAKGASRAEIERLAADLRISTSLMDRALMAATFGAGWCDLERVSPTLMRVPVPLSQLAAETEAARAILRSLRKTVSFSAPIYPGDTGLLASVTSEQRLAASPE
jgi:GT2 family glycosyltransferase